MPRRPGQASRIFVLLCVLAAVLTVGGPSAASDVPRLVGTVGPGFTMGLTDADGTPVVSVVAGRYDILVHDLSDMHNFVLAKKATGERAAETEVEFVGDMTFSADLTLGLWVYACSPHFQTMNGTLTVVAPAPPAPSPPPEVKTIRATVTSTRVSLLPRRVSAGRYMLSVVDRSKSRGFRLVGGGITRETGRLFTGTRTWRLRLRAGTYRFGDDRKLSGRLTVTTSV